MSIVHQCIVNCCRMIWKENSLPTEYPRRQSSLRFGNTLLFLRFETMMLTTTVTVWMMRFWKHLFTQSLSMTTNKCLGFFFIWFYLFVWLHLPSVCNGPIDLSILLLNLFEHSAQSVRKILFRRENNIWVTCYRFHYSAQLDLEWDFENNSWI